MNVLWSYFWPVLAAGWVIGVLAGSLGFRRGRRNLTLAIGFAAAVGAAAIWHGPLGSAERLAGRVESAARQSLDYYEMSAVAAHLQRGPLTRRLILSGPADDFQRAELVRLFGQVPGASGATWSADRGGLPLLLEAIGAALAAFLIGVVLAYLRELRRRYNAQWKW